MIAQISFDKTTQHELYTLTVHILIAEALPGTDTLKSPGGLRSVNSSGWINGDSNHQ
ncbi:MAG: hypothetical protein MI975_00600 [Cytophagales bacterium]|nr:hypothetical protein [Cytophagales bacterium]